MTAIKFPESRIKSYEASLSLPEGIYPFFISLWFALPVVPHEAQSIVVRGPSNILTHDLPKSFLSSDIISR